MCLNNLFGLSDSSAISVEHITQIAFPNMSVTPNLLKRDPSASYMTVSLAYNSVPLESNYPECKTTKQIFYTSAGCAPGTKKVKAECLPKISEDHR